MALLSRQFAIGVCAYAVMSHKRAFEFFGGVPQLVVPDCLKSAVSVARNTDPDLNPTYQMLAAHFGTAIMPARPRQQSINLTDTDQAE